MDFRSSSIYKCSSPLRLCRLSVPLSSHTSVTYRPRRVVDYATGEFSDVFVPSLVHSDNRSIPLVVRCGKCEHCRKYQNDEWRNRMIMEQIGSDSSVFFVTLSFGECYFDKVASVEKTQVYRDYVVPFKKRLRSYGVRFRFYCVSELGENYGRFHFHLLLFIAKESIVSLSALAKGFCDNYASLSLPYDNSLRLFVKGSDKRFRLQTDIEVYLQCLVMRAWTECKQRYDVPPGIHFTYKNGKRVKSVSYPDQIGWVTLSQCESFGAFHYVTSYATKCIHDGIVTYHRQSPALGKCYVDNNVRGSKDMLSSGVSRLDYWTFGSLPTFIPRYFIRKFMPEDLRIRRFWQYYNSLPNFSKDETVINPFDKWSSEIFLSMRDFFAKFVEPDRPPFDEAWFKTCDFINDQIALGKQRKFTNKQISDIYNNFKKQTLCTKSKMEVKNTSQQLTLF